MKRVAEGKFSKYELKKAGWIISGIEGKEMGRELVRQYAKEVKNEEERKRLEDPLLNVFWSQSQEKWTKDMEITT